MSEKWERRDKKLNKKNKMKVSGKSSRLLNKIIIEKSEKIKRGKENE